MISMDPLMAAGAGVTGRTQLLQLQVGWITAPTSLLGAKVRVQVDQATKR